LIMGNLMTDENSIVRKGRLLNITEGAYSDFGNIGFFVVLQDFDLDEVLETYLKDRPEQSEDYAFGSSEFVAYLIRHGLLLDVDYDGIYLGSYNTASGVSFSGRKR